MRLRAQDGLSGVSACIGSRFHSGGGALSNACRRTDSSALTRTNLKNNKHLQRDASEHNHDESG